MRALFDCAADHETELSFHKGDLISQVTETAEGGWYEGVHVGTGLSGLFPSNYVSAADD